MQKIEGKRTVVILTSEQLSDLERIRRRHDTTLSEAIRITLDLGLDVYTDFEKAGIPQIAEATKKAKNAIRSYLQPRTA